MITDDAMEVHFGLITVTIIPVLTRPGNCGTCSVGQVISQRRIREVDEARLCGSSLPLGPIALPALGRSRPRPKNPT